MGCDPNSEELPTKKKSYVPGSLGGFSHHVSYYVFLGLVLTEIVTHDTFGIKQSKNVGNFYSP